MAVFLKNDSLEHIGAVSLLQSLVQNERVLLYLGNMGEEILELHRSQKLVVFWQRPEHLQLVGQIGDVLLVFIQGQSILHSQLIQSLIHAVNNAFPHALRKKHWFWSIMQLLLWASLHILAFDEHVDRRLLLLWLLEHKQ